MMRPIYFFSLFLVFTLACATVSSPVVVSTATSSSQNREPPTQVVANPPELPNSALVDFYDPARNPAEDLMQAIPIAQKKTNNA